jgi:hypothetical protein
VAGTLAGSARRGACAGVWSDEELPRAAPAPGRVTARSVVVLPFANTSGDPANEPFADGLTDELIGALGRAPGLRVTPRTSTFALKGRGLADAHHRRFARGGDRARGERAALGRPPPRDRSAS